MLHFSDYSKEIKSFHDNILLLVMSMPSFCSRDDPRCSLKTGVGVKEDRSSPHLASPPPAKIARSQTVYCLWRCQQRRNMTQSHLSLIATCPPAQSSTLQLSNTPLPLYVPI